jgi:hypothetical protein
MTIDLALIRVMFQIKLGKSKSDVTQPMTQSKSSFTLIFFIKKTLF